MIFYHPTTSSTGIAVSHHKVSRVELSQDLLDVMLWIESWPTEQNCLDGLPAAARWHVRTPSSTLTVGADLTTALTAAVLAAPDFAGASTIANNALAIDTLRARKWSEVKAERSRRLVGTFMVGVNVFDCNESAMAGATLAAFMALYAASGVTAAYRQTWVLADNTQVSLTAAEMIAVGVAGKEYVTGLWETSQRLRVMIDAATTADEVGAVGWPAAH